MAEDSAAWLDQLPAEMAAQAGVLRGLVAIVRSDERLVALQVQGSIGRGEGDRMSDLDVGLVIRDTQWPFIADDVPAMVHSLGEVVDDHYEFLPRLDAPEVLRAWAQFANGVQLDMLVLPSNRTLGSGPDGRTLVDPEGVLPRTDHPMRLTNTDLVAKWSFLCWHNLSEAVKNIRRKRYVAAAEWYGSARLATISCWGVAKDIEYAGLAIVVAARMGVNGAPRFEGLENAYPKPEREELLRASESLADLQTEVEAELSRLLGTKPRALGPWVRAEIDALRTADRDRDSPTEPGSHAGTGRPALRRSRARRGARPAP
jgi:predicted nucleotidyltransferase